MRRRPAPTDSLELLLDTICNTFGGVLFIAILVVLLLQMTPDSPKPSDQTPVMGVPAATAESQIQEISMLEREIERQQENLKASSELIDRLATKELKELLEEKKQVEAEEARLKETISQLSDLTADADKKESQTRQELADLNHRKQSLEQSKQELEGQYDDLRSERTFDIRLPKVRTAPLKHSIGIVIRYGRMYLWHRYDNDMNRLGLNTDDFIVTEETETEIFSRPDPSRGIVLNGSDEMNAKIKMLLGQFSSADCYLTFVVRSDSFAEFRHARDVVKELDFEYRLMPGDGPVRDRGGSAGFVQ